jgi:hypothetical protein
MPQRASQLIDVDMIERAGTQHDEDVSCRQ